MATLSPHKALTSLQGLCKAYIKVRKVFFMACKAFTAIHGLKCFLHGLSSCRGLHSLPRLPILSKFLMAYKAFEGLPQPQGLSGFLRASLCLFFLHVLADIREILLSLMISLQFLINLRCTNYELCETFLKLSYLIFSVPNFIQGYRFPPDRGKYKLLKILLLPRRLLYFFIF